MSRLVVATAVLAFTLPTALRADVLSKEPTPPQKQSLFGCVTHGTSAYPRSGLAVHSDWQIADAAEDKTANAAEHEGATASGAMHFPDNETTTLPVIVTKGGDEAFKKDVAALQQTLTEL